MRKWLLFGIVLATMAAAVASHAASSAPQKEPSRPTKVTTTAPAANERLSLKRLRGLYEAKPPSSWAESRQRAKSVARKVRKRYEELSLLSMEITVQRSLPKYPVVVKDTIMRPKAFVCKMSVDGSPIFEFAFHNGKITEHRFPFRRTPDETTTYEVREYNEKDGNFAEDSISGLGECRFQDDIPSEWLCLMGGHGQTWVGPNIKLSALQEVTDRLEEDSWFIGKEDLAGIRCSVFFYRFSDMPIGVLLYIDDKHSLLRKIISFQLSPEHTGVVTTTASYKVRDFEPKGSDTTAPMTKK